MQPCKFCPQDMPETEPSRMTRDGANVGPNTRDEIHRSRRGDTRATKSCVLPALSRTARPEAAPQPGMQRGPPGQGAGGRRFLGQG